MALTKDEILNSDDRKVEEIAVPEWGGKVYIRTLKGKERDNYEASLSVVNGKVMNAGNFRARFAVLVLCDEDGKRLFTDSQAMALGDKSAKPIDRIWDAGRKFNSMDDEDIGVLEGNSDSGQSDDSGSN